MNEAKLILLHTLTPLHVGTGQALANVDLPIAREKATGFPIIPASAFKGVLRDYFKFYAKWNEKKLVEAFGSEPPKPSKEDETPSTERELAGGDWAFTDLRILCLPVRSFYGTFAYVTCPLVLKRFVHVVQRLGIDITLGEIHPVNNTEIALTKTSVLSSDDKVYLEELDLSRSEADVTDIAQVLARSLFRDAKEGEDLFLPRFAMVSDQVFDYLSETATEIAARVRLEDDKKTVAKGALWYEECVPAESIFYGFATHVKAPEYHLPFDELKSENSEENQIYVQIGGDATIGRGLSRVVIV